MVMVLTIFNVKADPLAGREPPPGLLALSLSLFLSYWYGKIHNGRMSQLKSRRCQVHELHGCTHEPP